VQGRRLTFTLDLEDHYPSPNPAPRYPAITYKILDFLSDRGVKGTFFVLGEVAEQHPELIRTVHQRGHEIGFHSYAHVPLDRENPQRFRDQTRRSKAFLEDLTGAEVIGFRAPIFSLTPKTLWALPIPSVSRLKSYLAEGRPCQQERRGNQKSDDDKYCPRPAISKVERVSDTETLRHE